MSSFVVSGINVCVFLCLLFVTVKSHATACNHGNDTTCLYGNTTYQGVRGLMQNSVYFWFGSVKYPVNCPANASRKTVECENPAPSYYSIFTRMRMSDDDDVSMVEQFLNVHYGVPEGKYMACGSLMTAPALDKVVDPVHTIKNDAWSLSHRPHVMWQAESGVNYTLAFWDAGWFELRGLWINIAGGMLEDGEEVLRYRGPMNPIARKSTVVFLLFKQTQAMTVADTYAVVERLREWNGLVNQIKMNEFVSEMSLTGPVGVSSIRTQVDTYSAHHGRQAGIINNCPYVRTKVLMARKDQLPWNLTDVHLTVSVDVYYESPEITFESCCRHHKMPRRTIHVDSRAPELLDPVYTRTQPMVKLLQTNIRDDPYFFDHPDRAFTLLLVDVTMVMANKTDKLHVHWQVINIRDPMLKTGETIVNYMGANVLVTSPERSYAFMLLEQSRPLTRHNVETYRGTDCDSHNRCTFVLSSFIKGLGLKLAGLSTFRSGVDPYSRRRMYTEGGHPRSAACVGLDYYRDPCEGTCSGVMSLPSLFTLLLSVVASLRAKF